MKNQIRLQNTRPNIWGAKYEIKSKTGINKANTNKILFCVICSLGIIQPTKKHKTAGAMNGVKTMKAKKKFVNNWIITSTSFPLCFKQCGSIARSRWKKFTSTYYTLKYAFSNKNFKLTHYCYNRNKKDHSKQEQSHFKTGLYNLNFTLSQLRHNGFNLLGSMNTR